MIELTRLNGNPLVVNSDLIKTAESSPDTMLTLINGEKLIVREGCAEVVERVMAYRARLLAIVARRLPRLGDLQRVVAISSLDLAGDEKTDNSETFDVSAGEKEIRRNANNGNS